MTSSVAGPRRSSRTLPKAKLAPKKGHSHCSVIHCPSDPLELPEYGKTIISKKYAQQINDMHQKLQRLQVVLVNRKGPILLHDNAQLHFS